MNPTAALRQSSLFKAIVFIAVFLAGYWFLEHWDDFKAGLWGDPAPPARITH